MRLLRFYWASSRIPRKRRFTTTPLDFVVCHREAHKGMADSEGLAQWVGISTTTLGSPVQPPSDEDTQPQIHGISWYA